jgi:hypothetical protein
VPVRCAKGRRPGWHTEARGGAWPGGVAARRSNALVRGFFLILFPKLNCCTDCDCEFDMN